MLIRASQIAAISANNANNKMQLRIIEGIQNYISLKQAELNCFWSL